MAMSMNVTTSSSDNIVVLSISGTFDYRSHDQFVSSYNQVSDVSEFVVDLENTDYLDSSALGMLLLLKDYADQKASTVKLSCPNDEVKSILEIAHFGQIFPIV